ncbi:hypothetical protein PTI98_007564 [Pleurotus ostreatus]|nr:hypothetical protein PTI98_007564 [Pleurotus ostreatus]
MPVEAPGEFHDWNFKAYTAYKRVGQKIHLVSGVYPEDAKVNELLTQLPDFIPTERLTEERISMMEVNKDNFLWPDEEKLFKHILRLNEDALAFEEQDRGTLKKEYFSDYIMATIPHTPCEYKNIPIPPGIKDKVIEMLRSKIDTGVYELCQSSY